jgi:hypothetical protein
MKLLISRIVSSIALAAALAAPAHANGKARNDFEGSWRNGVRSLQFVSYKAKIKQNAADSRIDVDFTAQIAVPLSMETYPFQYVKAEISARGAGVVQKKNANRRCAGLVEPRVMVVKLSGFKILNAYANDQSVKGAIVNFMASGGFFAPLEKISHSETLTEVLDPNAVANREGCEDQDNEATGTKRQRGRNAGRPSAPNETREAR